MKKAIFEKLLRWLLFGVVLAVLPLIFNYISGITKRLPTDLKEICSKGELLLVCSGIAAASIGEMIGKKSEEYTIFKLIAAGECITVLFLASLWYADIAMSASRNASLDTDFIYRGSTWILIATLLSSGSCVALAEM